MHIIPCRATNDLLTLLGGNLLDLLGRDTGIDGVGLELLVGEDQGIGGDDASRGDMSVVENGGTHPDQAVVLDDGAMNGGVVSHRNVAADMGLRGVFRAIVKGVEDGSVLDVGAVADGDLVHIATQHSPIPDRAILAHGYIAKQYGRLGQKGAFTYLRLMASDFSDNSHISIQNSKFKINFLVVGNIN